MADPTFANNIRELWTGTTTSTITLSGTKVPGPPGEWRIFSGNVTNGATVTVHIQHQTVAEFQTAVYTYDSGAGTLTYVSLLASSTGSQVTFSAGTKHLGIVIPAEAINLIYDKQYATTPTAAGTTTLTVDSKRNQFFTGVTTQTVVLPVASTLVLGHQFRIVNNSTGTLTVNSSGGNLVASVIGSETLDLTCILASGTSAASWGAMFSAWSAVTGTGANVLAFSPSITSPTLLADTVIGGGASASQVQFLEPSGSGTNYTAFQAQAQSGNVTYTLPAADGSESQQLSTDGAGTLSWASVQQHSICEGRLTLTTAVPVTTTDVTAATTIYFTPYIGDRISLLVGTKWLVRQFTETTLAVQSSLFRLMDVYAYDNAGTPALEQVAWDSGGQTTKTITGATNATPIVITSVAHGLSVGNHVGIAGVGGTTAANAKHPWRISAVGSADTFTLEGSVGNGAYTSGGTAYLVPTARTTAIVRNGTNAVGTLTKSGDPTRKYLGTYMTTNTSGQTEDSVGYRLVANYYNALPRRMFLEDTTSHTYATATARAWNNTPANRIVWVSTLAERSVVPFIEGGITPAAAGTEGILGASLNQITLAGQLALSNANGNKVYAGLGRVLTPAIGHNYVVILEYAAGANVTFNTGKVFMEMAG